LIDGKADHVSVQFRGSGIMRNDKGNGKIVARFNQLKLYGGFFTARFHAYFVKST
jgi:hypothetical protein